jgi:FdhD protein
MAEPVQRSVPLVWRGGESVARERIIPEEAAIALTYGRATYAVMMGTPADLEDFAIGFSLNEQIIAGPAEIEELNVVPRGPLGVELRMLLSAERDDAYVKRRRHVTGVTGCGMCGLESLEEATRLPPRVSSELRLSAAALSDAMNAIGAMQVLNRQTHAVHAAAFYDPASGVVALREDVGRHNALDKLAGALARGGTSPARGAVLLTSRVSVEMVNKAAMMGAPVLIAVSAPTALAVRVAEAVGITLAAVARADGFEVFTHPARILMPAAAHVA